MKNAGKSRVRWGVRKLLISLVVLLLLAVAGAGVLFREELSIIRSIEKIVEDRPVYYMEINGDYHFEEFLQAGGATSDRAVSAFLTKRISKGFYSVDVEESNLGCSVIAASTPEGAHVWGRNFDWTGSVPILVRCIPQDGYASISTCDFQNITSSPSVFPEGIANQMLAIAALYVPMDGVNEAGLCVADLEVNEGGMISVDTDKPDLTITTAIRLLLNKAATVEEAIELLGQYDIHPSGGISHHLAIADASGTSVVVEFMAGDLVVVETNAVTNFNLASGDTASGGENAKQRFEALNALYEENEGMLTAEQVKQALTQVSQSDGKWTTQWSIVYEQASLTARYYFNRDFETAYSLPIRKP